MIYRFLRFLVLVVIFYGAGLALLGLLGSTQQAASGFAELIGVNSGLEMPGARVVRPARVPVSGALLPASPTPFQPVPPTAAGAAQTPQPAPPERAAAQPGARVEAASPPKKTAPTPMPSPTVRPIGVPDRIVIKKIDLDAPVVIIPRLELVLGADVFEHWQAPSFFAAGWHEGSAFLGEKGNSVLSGHHNIAGKVFGRLKELKQYDEITVYSGKLAYHYRVSQVMRFEERYAPVAQRIQNAQWILPSDDERLTLVTCWPPESNTYRLIVVAVPAE